MARRHLSVAIGGIVLAALGAVLALRAAEEQPPTRPNVILITIDTLRADYVGAYGSRVASTPSLDWVAAQGAVFERAHCDVTWTTPSMTSTMLGQFATRHGLQTTFQTLDDSHVTLAEMLKSNGYATAAVIGSYPLSKIYNLDQGFDVYDDEFTRPLIQGDAAAPSTSPERAIPSRPTKEQIDEGNNFAFLVSGRRTDAEVSERAISRLAGLAAGDKPFFLWVHYFGPHLIPNPKLNLFEDHAEHIRTYARRTGETDRQVGRLLAAVDRAGIERNTLLVIHSDHGESLSEHDFVGHGRYLYEDNLHVPLLVRWPEAIAPGTRSSELVGNVDIASTILDATGTTRAPRPFDGISLLGLLRDGNPGHESLILETWCPTLRGFGESIVQADGSSVEVGAARFGVLRGHDKFIRTEHRPLLNSRVAPPDPAIAETVNRRELYNLEGDPLERRDRTATAPATATKLERELDLFRSGHAGAAAKQLEDDPEHSEKLRSLGYVQ